MQGDDEDGRSCEDEGERIDPPLGEYLRDRKAGDINILLIGLGERRDDEHVDEAGDGCWIRGNTDDVDGVDDDETDTLSVLEKEEEEEEAEQGRRLEAALKLL